MITRPADRSVVVIGGMARSGTGLTRGLLDAHRDVCAVTTDWAVLPNRYDQLAKLTGMEAPATEAEMRRAFEAILEYPPTRKWSLRLDDVLQVERTLEPSWDAVFVTILEAFRRRRPCPWIALKTPTSENRFVELKQLLERQGWSVRFLYSVRHPFHAYLSWKHREAAPNFCHTRSAYSSPYEWSARWLKSTTCALEFHYLHPQLLRIIRFEDILDAPERQARSLCEFLGLEDRASEMVALKGAVPNSSFDTAGVGTVRGGVLDLRSRTGAKLDENEKGILEIACARRAGVLGYYLRNGASEGVPSRCVEYQAALEQIPTRQLLNCFCRVVSRRLLNDLTRRK